MYTVWSLHLLSLLLREYCGTCIRSSIMSISCVCAVCLQLALKTVNSARSAYASFLFCRNFFHSYSDGQRIGNSEEEEEEEVETIKCKITIKVKMYINFI